MSGIVDTQKNDMKNVFLLLVALFTFSLISHSALMHIWGENSCVSSFGSAARSKNIYKKIEWKKNILSVHTGATGLLNLILKMYHNNLPYRYFNSSSVLFGMQFYKDVSLVVDFFIASDASFVSGIVESKRMLSW